MDDGRRAPRPALAGSRPTAGCGASRSATSRYYDHVLDAALAVGAVPGRFGGAPFDPGASDDRPRPGTSLMARGGPLDGADRPARDDEVVRHQLPLPRPRARARPDVRGPTGPARSSHLAEATALGSRARVVLVGPLTFLGLAKRTDGGDPIELLDAVLPAYVELVDDAPARPEPTRSSSTNRLLVTDLPATARAAYPAAYARSARRLRRRRAHARHLLRRRSARRPRWRCRCPSTCSTSTWCGPRPARRPCSTRGRRAWRCRSAWSTAATSGARSSTARRTRRLGRPTAIGSDAVTSHRPARCCTSRSTSSQEDELDPELRSLAVVRPERLDEVGVAPRGAPRAGPTARHRARAYRAAAASRDARPRCTDPTSPSGSPR